MNIHAGSKPEVDTQFLHLLTHNIACLFNQMQIPGLCQERRDGNRRRVLIVVYRVSGYLWLGSQSLQKLKAWDCHTGGQDIPLRICLEAAGQAKSCRPIRSHQIADSAIINQKRCRIPGRAGNRSR